MRHGLDGVGFDLLEVEHVRAFTVMLEQAVNFFRHTNWRDRAEGLALLDGVEPSVALFRPLARHRLGCSTGTPLLKVV